jgi:hypothetical protein
VLVTQDALHLRGARPRPQHLRGCRVPPHVRVARGMPARAAIFLKWLAKLILSEASGVPS